MNVILFILLVIVVILLLSQTNKLDKVRTQLDHVHRRTVTLSEGLDELQRKVNGLGNTGVTSSTPTVEQEEIAVVPSPIPVEPPPIPVHPLADPVQVQQEEIPVLEEEQLTAAVFSSLDATAAAVATPLSSIETFERPPLDLSNASSPYVAKEQGESKFIKGVKEVNWLNAIGIITLVLGIGFFVKYAIDQDWINEVGRVALGIVVGGIIVGVAHKLSDKYRVFSSVLLGGGFATFYTTITLAFREYEIFTQTTAFVILIIITVLAILLSIAYKRQEMAIFAFIGGMLSPMLVSTGSGNHVVLFSYILLLNTGVLIVAVRQQWLIIDKFSAVLTFLYLSTWLLVKYEATNQGAAMLFTSLFFLQFMLLLVLRYHRKTQEKSPWGQLLYIVLTNFAALLCFFMIHARHSGVNYLGVIIIAMALVNALFIVQAMKTKGKTLDKNFVYTLLAITIGLVSLAIPVQLSKVYITIVWAVEMAVLFWIWTRTKANLFRVGSLLLSVLTVLSYLMDIRSFGPVFEYNEESGITLLVQLLPIVVNQYTLTGMVVFLAFFFVYRIASRVVIEEGDTIGLKSLPQFNLADIQKGTRIALYAIAYLTVFLELSYQVGCRIEYTAIGTYSGAYKAFCLIVYTLVFATVYLKLNKHKINKVAFVVYTILFALLLLLYVFSVTAARSSIFAYGLYSSGYFVLHLLGFATLLYYCVILYREISVLEEQSSQVLNALFFGSIVCLFSVELDNLITWMFSSFLTYARVLSNVHAYGYPILWGIMAMLLMIVGINKQKAEWRKLSLLSFAIIILKFYLYDVWRMNQGGKIASFVVLGIILLVVSFLLERIKLLLKDKDNQKTDHPKEEESSN